MNTPVDNANRAAYLANVLCIAKINDTVAPAESIVVRSIIHRIGATQQDLVAAGKLLSSGNFGVQVSESLALRMDNLQDMVMVALADGDVSETEGAPIEKLAKAMHYSQADIDLAVTRAKHALAKIGVSTSGTLPAPPIPSPKTAKREPRSRKSSTRRRSWRDEITKAKSVPPLPDPTPAKAAPKPASVSAPEPTVSSTEPEETLEAVHHVAPPPPGPAATRAQACAACRATCKTPTAYCFGAAEGPVNPWGCRLSGMLWEQDAVWLSLGHFRDDVTFVFDKRLIAKRLASNLADVLDCPHLDTAFTEAAFDCLPERVCIGIRWQYQKVVETDAEGTTVRQTHYIHGCAVSSTAKVDGVDPVGTREALKIIRKAAKRTEREDSIGEVVAFLTTYNDMLTSR
jgi:uncharacterized tellurite resistance protein B-like protein